MPRAVLAILASGMMSLSGCTFNFMDQSIIARPAVRVPGFSYLEPDGDRVSQDIFEPQGDAVLLIVRVRPKEAVEKAAPWKTGDAKGGGEPAGD